MESWNNVHMHAWRARKPEACGLWKGRDTSVWKALDGTEPSGEPKTPRGPPEAPNTKARAYTNFTGTQSAEKRTVSLPFSRSSVTIQSVSLPFRDDFDPYIHEHSDDDYNCTCTSNLYHWMPTRLLNTSSFVPVPDVRP